MPHGSLDTWAETFVSLSAPEDSVKTVARRLRTELSAVLEPLSKRGWGVVRRGAHVAGFINGLPFIYHVHMGEQRLGEHPPKLHPEYPTAQMSTVDQRQHLADGSCAQSRN